jgi:uncharacterized protein (TIGR03437 family)
MVTEMRLFPLAAKLPEGSPDGTHVLEDSWYHIVLSMMAITQRLIGILSISLLCQFGLFAQQSHAAQPDRIAGRLDPTHSTALKGNIHSKARPENDRGPVSPNLILDYVTLQLKPTSAQQADLDQLLTEMQDSKSPNFRKWLTPEEYADRFGSSQSDLAQIAAWLEGQGLTVVRKARGRNFVVFKGTAGQVEGALHVEIHNFLVDGEMHFANATEPSVPAAIQSFTIGFHGLDDFKLKPPRRTSKPVPAYNYNGSHVLGPADLWNIYDIWPFYYAGWTGAGMTLAVMGQSNVNLSDMAQYRNNFTLPANAPTKLLIPGGTDPGIVSGDSGESDLDLEVTGAIVPEAEILFVYATDISNSVGYAIDSAVAPVISYSYSQCEGGASTSIAAVYQTRAQQANAQGMTWLASTGDVGAAACEPDGEVSATHGISVNLPASVPEVTGVGGTEFSEGSFDTYWASSNLNDPTYFEYNYSALSYIPEIGWNDTTDINSLSASGGGMSIYFPRPVWQSGPGVQSLNVRFVPDVALAGSQQHDPYYTVEGGAASEVGGTSASTPLMAGIVLLMNQYLGTKGLGNINPGLYALASHPANVCNTGAVTATSTCVFHDVTAGTNLVPCKAGLNGCIGGYMGYSAGPGYDMVTGLGSVDAVNLILAWQAAATPVVAQIFNAASFVDGGLSPGLIFSVKGSGLGPSIGQTEGINSAGNISTNLNGVQVLVNGTPAPILYASATQINAVAPYEIANMVGEHVSVQVVNSGVVSASISDPVVATAPAMFNLGNNQAAIINQDGTVNGSGNPAARGTYVSIYATGEGQTNPPGIDGFVPTSASNLSYPTAAVSVFMDQFSAQVLYAGTASFDGFFQINAVVPTGLSTGLTPITLTVGGVASPTLNIYVK